MTDVTDQKNMEKALSESEKRYRTLVSASSEVLYRMSPDWSEMRQLNGGGLLANTERPNRNWLQEYIYSDDRPKVLATVKEAIRTKGVFEFEHRVEKADGTLGWTRSRAVPLFDTNGEIVEWFGEARDITQRKRADQAVEEERARLQAVLDIAPAGIFIGDKKGKDIVVNKAFYQIWGIEAPSIEGVEDYQEYTAWFADNGRLIEVDDWPASKALKGEESSIIADIERFDGKKGTIILSAAPLKDVHGNVTGIVPVQQDITELRKAEEGLRLANDELEQRVKERTKELTESEARYRSLFENSIDGVLLTKPDGMVLSANSAACRMFRMTAEELKKEGRAGIVVSDDRLEHSLQERLRTGRNQSELTLKRGDGTTFEGEVSSNIFTDADGSTKTSMFIRDITERRRVEEALGESEERYRTLFESIDEGFCIIEKMHTTRGELVDFRYLTANPAFARYTGLDDVVGRTMREVVPGELQEWYDTYDAVLRNGEPIRFERSLLTNGRVLELYASRVEDGTGRRVAVVFNDITKRKRVEEEIRRSNAELQQFAYIASHDLQEPLRMVIGYLTILERRYSDKLDTDAQGYIQFAVDGGKRMRELIDDLLRYSRVETQGKNFDMVDMDGVVLRVIDVLEIPIGESKAEVVIDPLPPIFADEHQMVQVMQNLIGNAIKFRGPESLRIRISATPGSGEWIFSVKDNGIGLKMENAERIFQMFQRLNNRGKIEGTGIGLAIAKKTVERHGGRIWVESEEGKGATFFFTIPKAMKDVRKSE